MSHCSESHQNIKHVSNSYFQMDKRKDPSSVDVKQVLLEMRKYRMGLIQTADQLRFSYLAVIEGAKFIMGDASVQVSRSGGAAWCGELLLCSACSTCARWTEQKLQSSCLNVKKVPMI